MSANEAMGLPGDPVQATGQSRSGSASSNRTNGESANAEELGPKRGRRHRRRLVGMDPTAWGMPAWKAKEPEATVSMLRFPG